MANIKNITVVGTDWHGGWSRQLANSLSFVGYNVNLITIDELYLAPWYITLVTKKLKSKIKNHIIQKKIANQISDNIPDLLISVNYQDIPEDTLCLLHRYGIKTFLWMGDRAYYYNMTKIKGFNILASYDKFHRNILAQSTSKLIEYLPTCGDNNIYKPQELDKDIDILFIGTIYGDKKYLRTSIMGTVSEHFVPKGKIVKIFGNKGWKDFYREHPTLKDCFEDRLVSNGEACELYNRSKIVINIDHPETIMSTCQRTYEIALSGAFQLCNYRQSIADEFFNNNELVFFRNNRELLEQIEKYLINENARNSYAKKAYNRALSDHTYKNRIDEMLKILERY